MNCRVTDGLMSGLALVDLVLGSPPGWLAASVATYCPCKVVEHLKYKSTQPRCQTTRVTLYMVKLSTYLNKFVARRHFIPFCLTSLGTQALLETIPMGLFFRSISEGSRDEKTGINYFKHSIPFCVKYLLQRDPLLYGSKV